MNILLFTENSHAGGLDTYIATLINHWPNSEDKLTLMCNEDHPGLEIIRDRLNRKCEIISYIQPKYWQLSTNLKRRMHGYKIARFLRAVTYLLRYILFFEKVRELESIFKNAEFDRLMVVNGGYPGGLSCRAAAIAWGRAGRKPLSVHNIHNFCTPPRWWEKAIENMIDRFVTRYTFKFVSVSKACADSLKLRRALRLSYESNLMFIHNGISQDYFVRDCQIDDNRKENNISSGSRLCLMISTYEKRKGHRFLFEVFKKVLEECPDTYLIVCGFGHEFEIEAVNSYLRESGLQERVFLFGFRDDVDSLFREADVLLVTSQEDEPFNLTIIEAMARRVPVVATAVGGIPEVIGSNDGGFLVDPNDINGFAKIVTRLLQDNQLRIDVGKEGHRRYLRQFQAEGMALEYAKLIRGNN